MINGIKLKPWIEETFNKQGFKKFTEIQDKTIPILLRNKNVIGISTTGSGKTYAFLLPTLNKLNLDDTLQAVIIVPTRELARQIYTNIIEFKKYEPLLKAQMLIGGNDYDKQIHKIQSFKPQILVTTVDRFLMALQNKQISPHNLQTVVLDEADMLMDLGFAKQLQTIMGIIDSVSLQKMAWSATLHDLLSIQLSKFFTDTKIITVGNSIYENPNITHNIIHTKEKLDTLSVFVKQYQPYLCIIFCNSKKSIDMLVKFLTDEKISVIALHADLDSRERKNVYKNVTSFKYQYIVASDLASRGIDIDGVSHIINWDLPDNLEWYVHRAGRCGRGKYKGDSYIFFDGQQEEKLLSLQSKKIHFNHLAVRDGVLVEKKYTLKKRTIKLDYNINLEIRKIASKKTKVKPGYKKKQQEEIRKLKQKSKRKYLEAKINRDRIKKYKQENSSN